jgi:predicted PurR-regulated permease PerM
MIITFTMVKVNKSLNIGIVFIVIIGIIIGSYYLGRSHGSSKIEKIVQQDNQELDNKKELLEKIDKNTPTLASLGLSFPNIEESITCTPEQPIKIKLDKGVSKYYTPKHKQYKVIKADLCGKDEFLLKRIPNLFQG